MISSHYLQKLSSLCRHEGNSVRRKKTEQAAAYSALSFHVILMRLRPCDLRSRLTILEPILPAFGRPSQQRRLDQLLAHLARHVGSANVERMPAQEVFPFPKRRSRLHDSFDHAHVA